MSRRQIPTWYSRILARYQVCLVTYELRVSSMNKGQAYYSELSNRCECANKRGVGTFFSFMLVKKRWWEKYSKRIRLCCTLIRELRLVTEPDSGPNSIPCWPATNLKLISHVTSLIHCRVSSSGSTRVKATVSFCARTA